MAFSKNRFFKRAVFGLFPKRSRFANPKCIQFQFQHSNIQTSPDRLNGTLGPKKAGFSEDAPAPSLLSPNQLIESIATKGGMLACAMWVCLELG